MTVERAEYSKADLARDYFLWFVLRIAAPFIPVIIHWIIFQNLSPKQQDFFKFPNETIILTAFIVPLATAKDTKSYWGIWLSFFAATTSIVLYTLALVAKAQQLASFFSKICWWGFANFIIVSIVVCIAEFFMRVINKIPPKVIEPLSTSRGA